MASPAACAQYSSPLRVSTAPRRRPASSSFSRVHIPPAARTPPRSLSVSLSVLRPRAHRGASDHQSAGDDAGFGSSPCDPAAVEGPYDIAATTDLSVDEDADGGFVLRGPFVEDPLDLVSTTGLSEGAHDEGDAELVLRVPTVDEPHEVTDLVLQVSAGRDPHEVADLLVLHVSAGEDSHELTATTDLCVVARDDASLVIDVPIVEEVADTTGIGDGAHDVDVDDDDGFVYPTRLTKKEADELEATDFSRAAIRERFRVESKEAKAAVTGAVVGVFRPLWKLLDDVRSLGSVFDVEEFQIGMPFGAIMTCMGMYQLWKLSPSTCFDVAMYYAFYKLSVIAADIRRRGFSPDWIIRLKLGIIIAVLAKELGNNDIVPLDFIRLAMFGIYSLSVMWDLKGFKKYASKFILPMVFYELSTGDYITEETCKSYVTEETGESHVTEGTCERHVKEETGESHVVMEETGESHVVTEKTGESHAVTKETGESHVVTEETGESHVVTEEMGESHVTEETGEDHVTEETCEDHVTEGMSKGHVTKGSGEGHVMEETVESHIVTKETGESHAVTEETGESHTVVEETGESHVIMEETGESHVAEETSEIHVVTEETIESHVTMETSQSHVREEMSESHV